MNKDEDKVIIKMTRKPLASEREEIKQKRVHRFIIALLCIVFLVAGVIGGYYLFDVINAPINKTINNELNEIEYIMNNYWLYGNDYENLNEELENKAYYGMTGFIEDPYTTYMSNEELNDFSSSINMDYVGIGVTYISYEDTATVTKVFKDSPAEKAGMLAGDIIKTIEGTSISGLSTEEIKEQILGVSGTIVKVGVLRNGTIIDLDITRGEVDSSVFCYSQDDYVVMELNSFGEKTSNNIINYLKEYTDYSKLIIDLRDNGGGYQTAIEKISGILLGNDKVYMIQVDKDGNERIDYSKSDVTFDNFKKIVILINSNTASAAEVLTMCLKEQFPDVTIVGETSYGKGVVQTTYTLSNGSAVKVTSSKWLSPNGVWINGEGISPDIEVKLPDIMYEMIYNMPEDVTYSLDEVSEYVRIAEECLSFLNYDVSRTDGYFDESFLDALNEFKISFNCKDDGILDSSIYEKIVSAAIHTASVDPQYDTQMLKAIEVINED